MSSAVPPPQGQDPTGYGQPGYGQQAYPPYGYPAGGGYGYPAGSYGAPVPGQLPASMGARLGARLLDGLIVGVPASVLFFVVTLGAVAAAPNSDEPPAWFYVVLVLLFLLTIVAAALYEILLTARTGSTLGKRVVGIRVTRSDGSPVSTGAAAKRWAVYYLPNLVPLLGSIWALLVAISPFFDSPRRQGWHNKVADTVVVPR